MSQNSNPITDGVKKLLLAGVGAVALTGEKAGDVINTLVEKGELTVEQGKELNKELKRTYEEHKNGDSKPKDIDSFVNGLSPEELEKLKETLKDK